MTANHMYERSLVSANQKSHGRRIYTKAKVKEVKQNATRYISTFIAWLYLVCYALFWLTVMASMLASFIVVFDMAVMLEGGSWGPGSAYHVFWTSIHFLKWVAILAVSFFAFFGGTYLIGGILRDARRGVPAKSKKSKVYMVFAIAFLLPGSLLRLFFENAEKYWGTLQVIDLVIDYI